MRRSRIVRSGGAFSSENAGVSSEMQVRILHTDSLRIPDEAEKRSRWITGRYSCTR